MRYGWPVSAVVLVVRVTYPMPACKPHRAVLDPDRASRPRAQPGRWWPPVEATALDVTDEALDVGLVGRGVRPAVVANGHEGHELPGSSRRSSAGRCRTRREEWDAGDRPRRGPGARGEQGEQALGLQGVGNRSFPSGIGLRDTDVGLDQYRLTTSTMAKPLRGARVKWVASHVSRCSSAPSAPNSGHRACTEGLRRACSGSVT